MVTTREKASSGGQTIGVDQGVERRIEELEKGKRERGKRLEGRKCTQ